MKLVSTPSKSFMHSIYLITTLIVFSSCGNMKKSAYFYDTPNNQSLAQSPFPSRAGSLAPISTRPYVNTNLLFIGPQE